MDRSACLCMVDRVLRSLYAEEIFMRTFVRFAINCDLWLGTRGNIHSAEDVKTVPHSQEQFGSHMCVFFTREDLVSTLNVGLFPSSAFHTISIRQMDTDGPS